MRSAVAPLRSAGLRRIFRTSGFAEGRPLSLPAIGRWTSRNPSAQKRQVSFASAADNHPFRRRGLRERTISPMIFRAGTSLPCDIACARPTTDAEKNLGIVGFA